MSIIKFLLFYIFLLSADTFAIRNGVVSPHSEGRFPNIVYINAVGECTGERITYNRVITVSHCIDKQYSGQKRFKVKYLDGTEIKSEKVNFSKVKKLSDKLDSELAVFEIRPKKSIETFRATKVIKFDGDESVIPKSFIIAGFGVTSDSGDSRATLRYGRSFFKKLKKSSKDKFLIFLKPEPNIEADSVSGETCEKAQASLDPLLGNEGHDSIKGVYKEVNGLNFKENQIVCKGDSGGPVYAMLETGEMVLLGINVYGLYNPAKVKNIKTASDQKVCKYFSSSAVIPIFSNKSFLDNLGIKINEN